jgi:signal transduction histidine kinase
MQPLDLVQVVRESVALVRNELMLRRIGLRMDCPPASVRVRGNAALLGQVVTNLVLNAVNAMSEDGGTLRVALEEEDGRAVLRLRDTGKGIPKPHLGKVFDPFFTTMPVGKGTGLGLSISYAIVRQHNGQIHVDSEAGKGTTVTVGLPLEPAAC